MELVLVLLFSALCGVHSASIPSDSDVLHKSDSTLETPLESKLASMLESKLDSELDTDNLKQSVLEGVKKLLDSKLSSLAGNRGDRVGSDGIPKKRPLKPKSRWHPLSNRKNEANQESHSSEEDSQNSEYIKNLTDDPNRDPGDKELREAVDELLEENKDNDEVMLDDGILDLEKITGHNNDEKISKDAYDYITPKVVNNNEKDRKGNKIDYRKKSNNVIEDYFTKMNKKDDVGNKLKVKLYEKLKSKLNNVNDDGDANDSDGKSANQKTKQVRNDMFLNRRNRYWKRKPYITKYLQKTYKVDNLKAVDSSKEDGINNVSNDENVLEMETPISSDQDKDGNNHEINTRMNSAGKNIYSKRKLFTHNSQNIKKDKDLLDLSESERKEDNYDDILGKLKKEDIETEINENQNQELIYDKEKPKRKLGKNHNNYRRIGRDKLEKNYNDKYERMSKPKPPTDLTVTSDLNDSKESWLDSIFGKEETQKETHHDIPLKLGKLEENNRKQTVSYDSRTSISKENSNNEELNDTTDDNNFDEDKGIIKDNAYEENEHDFQLKDFLINNKRKTVKVESEERKDDKRFQEDIKFWNEEDITERDNDVTSGGETVVRKYFKDREDYIFEKEENTTKKDNDVTYVDIINNKGKKKHVTKDTLYTEEDKNASKKGKHSCRENNVESDETKIIRDLIENKEVKKSFSFSLNFISQ